MVKLRDHYFIAWLKTVKKYEISLTESGIYVNMTNAEYTEALAEYKSTLKPILKEIRHIVKELSIFTSNSKIENKKI